MANQYYDNFFLANEVEDQFNSYLDLQTFFTVNNSLVGTPGMLFKVNKYSATDGTEKLQKTKGNTKTIEVSYDDDEYRITLAQNRFAYYDEEAMTDPMLVPVGMRHAATDMFNTVNTDVYTELGKCSMEIKATAWDFGVFVDGQAKMNFEAATEEPTFTFVSPEDYAAIRKALKDTLQYVESYARTGYVGTVAGTNIYVKKDAVKGTAYLATKNAVTMFNKKGVEVEQVARSEDEANVRRNVIFTRKYYVAALTDDTKVVKLSVGSAVSSS